MLVRERGRERGKIGYKNLCRRNAVEKQRFHTLNTHDIKPGTKQQHSLQTANTLELDFGPFPPDVANSFPPESSILSSVVCLGKMFPPTSYTGPPSLYVMNKVSTIGSQMEVKP